MKNNKNQQKGQDQPKSWILNLLIEIIDSGVLALLPGSTIKIYFVQLRHRLTDRQGFTMSAKRIMEESGVKKRHTFCDALNQLEAAGLNAPRKRSSKKFHYMNTYEIPLNPTIKIMNLKAELNRQKKHRYSCAENGHKSKLKKGVLPKMGKATLVPKNGKATLMPKMGKDREVKEVKDVFKKEERNISSSKGKKEFKKKLEKEMNKTLPCGEKEFEALQEILKKKKGGDK